MLSVSKLKELCQERKISIEQLAGQLVRPGFDKKAAVSAVKNWQRGLFKPIPRKEDIRRLAAALSAEVNDLADWRSSYRYAPISARKAKLVTQLIVGRGVQDAMDTLKFTRKRAASMVDKILRSAVADADEQQADVDNLYVSQACVDDAGVRIGTKRWIAKDRGKAYPIRQKACHIHITVTQA
ncbi:MAG: 50S ribosomal protein L22 [Planctomycetota bacterium]|jgi:large subunit ribosomal protein L22|nr:50S ribosomal protein L22 [Planctomycetota bacterium]